MLVGVMASFLDKFVENITDECFFCRIAYVRQEDIFFSQLTVRETLSLAAELQLPDTMSLERKEKYVNDLLFRLGLVSG
jgi:ABC-type multidrug transport system ATPase subunit